MTPTAIVIHHSATPDNAATMSTDDIRRFHTSPKPAGRGWRTIGYHLVMEQVEQTVQGILGCPFTQAGIHAPPRNHNTLGVCLVGNFELAEPGRGLVTEAARRVADLAEVYRIPTDQILAHRDVKAGHTVCPGRFFDIVLFRELVAMARIRLAHGD